MVWISILWYLSSVLVITMGAASVAMYYTVHVRIFKGEGYLFPVYKKAFTENFKKATVLFVICLLLDAFLVFDFLLARMAIDQGSALAVFYYPVLVCMVLAFMWQISMLAYQARFEDTLKNVLIKGAGLFAADFGWMIFLTAVLIGGLCLCRYLILLVVVLPGGYTCLVHHVFEHIFKKRGWIPETEPEECSP